MGLNTPGHTYTGIMLVLYKGMGWVSMPLVTLTLGFCWSLQGHGMGLNVPGHAYTGIMLVLYKGMGWVSMSLATPTLGLCWSLTMAWDGSQCPWPRLHWVHAGPFPLSPSHSLSLPLSLPLSLSLSLSPSRYAVLVVVSLYKRMWWSRWWRYTSEWGTPSV